MNKDTDKKKVLNRIGLVNTLLEEEGNEKGLGRKNSLQILSGLKGDNTAYSARAKLEFTEIVRRTLMVNWDARREKNIKPVGNRKVLENKGARLLKLSPVTTKRYMDVLRTPGGPFAGQGDDVHLNPYYVKPDEDDYWLDVDGELGGSG